MKRHLVYLCVIFFIPLHNTNLSAQKISSGIIEYEVVLLDKEKIDSIEDLSTRKLFREISSMLSQKTFFLEFDTEQAYFKSPPKLPLEDDKSEMVIRMVNVMVGENESYYRDDKLKKTYKFDSFRGNNYVIELRKVEDWDFSEETKIILGYKCKKASRKYEQFNERKGEYVEFNPVVWYCPELPLPYGPIGFDGLPGLVLEGTNNNKIVYRAKKVQLNKKVDIKPKFKGERIDQDKFEGLINRM